MHSSKGFSNQHSERHSKPAAGRQFFAMVARIALFAGLAGASAGILHAADRRPANADDSPKPQRRHTNRLARETSPYLLMHAHDPVDWYAWSPEVFDKARREGKPIFLSIGYSSCHWCHVTERLVFENEAIARTMNENFVNVKVDREERPDVDDVYMTAYLLYAQAIGSPDGGGWPLSLFLTADGKPFVGGTYFPEKDVDGRTGFPTVLARVHEAWRDKRETAEKNANALAAEVRRVMRRGLSLTPVKLDRGLANAATKALIDSSDPQFGGVDFDRRSPNSPKFPVPAKLALLEYEAGKLHNGSAAATLSLALDHMAAGGIRDHLGGGFHRYSTDRHWHIPHFEKMLYDQGQLAELYADAFHRTGNCVYRRVAVETYEFILKEMADPSGGFISSLDAETDGVEGTYYVWSSKEIDSVLGASEAGLFKRVYGLEEPKEFEQGYVLHETAPVDSLSAELRISPDVLERRLDASRVKLLARRRTRPPLRRDDKIITAWNGLMIRSLAHGGALLGREDYVRAAEKGARFVLKRMRGEHGELLRTYRADQAKILGYLEDYAYFTDGLLALYETTHDEEWLRDAHSLCDDQVRLFWDDESKGFFFTSPNHESLIARTRNAFDAVLPSANSVSVRNLQRLAAFTREAHYRQLARETLEAFAPALAKAPASLPCLALALDKCLDDPAFQLARSTADLLSTADDDLIVQTAAQSAPRSGRANPDSKIIAKAYLSVDKLPPGGTCRIVVFVKIKQGWHINANSIEDSKVRTELSLTSKLGTKMTQVVYLKGRLAPLAGNENLVPIYEKETAIRGVLTIPAEAAGQVDELKLKLHYQACNDRQCDAPADYKLTARVQVAADLADVRAVNSKMFPKTGK